MPRPSIDRQLIEQSPSNRMTDPLYPAVLMQRFLVLGGLLGTSHLLFADPRARLTHCELHVLTVCP